MIKQIVTLMQYKKQKNNFKSYTLNIVYDSICEVLKVCHKLNKNISDCFRSGIIKELKHSSNNKIPDELLVKNSIRYFLNCMENTNE